MKDSTAHTHINNRVYKVWCIEIKHENGKESIPVCLEWFYYHKVNNSNGMVLRMAHELGMIQYIEQVLEVYEKESIVCPGYKDFACFSFNQIYGKKIIDYGAFLMAMQEIKRTLDLTNNPLNYSFQSRDFFKYLFVLQCCQHGTLKFICSKIKF